MNNDKYLDNNILVKADIIVLQAIAETIINSMIQNNGSYNSKQYGSIDNYKNWSKHNLIKWLLQFNLKLGNEISKDNTNSNNKEIKKQELNELQKEKEELQKQKEELQKQKEELEELQKLKEEIKKQKEELEKQKEKQKEEIELLKL